MDIGFFTWLVVLRFCMEREAVFAGAGVGLERTFLSIENFIITNDFKLVNFI